MSESVDASFEMVVVRKGNRELVFQSAIVWSKINFSQSILGLTALDLTTDKTIYIFHNTV